jgi:uncharacterized protein
LLKKVRQVEKIFKVLDGDMARLRKVSGVLCPDGCILCCLKPDIQASVLEFLPLAWHLVSTEQHEDVLLKIETGQQICVSLITMRNETSSAGCRFYEYRGAICRLFGSAAMRNNKTDKLALYACKTQKENYAESWNEITDRINRQKNVPLIPEYYSELNAVDHYLANDYNPINQSLYKAIGKVLIYFKHNPRPKSPYGKVV